MLLPVSSTLASFDNFCQIVDVDPDVDSAKFCFDKILLYFAKKNHIERLLGVFREFFGSFLDIEDRTITTFSCSSFKIFIDVVFFSFSFPRNFCV